MAQKTIYTVRVRSSCKTASKSSENVHGVKDGPIPLPRPVDRSINRFVGRGWEGGREGRGGVRLVRSVLVSASRATPAPLYHLPKVKLARLLLLGCVGFFLLQNDGHSALSCLNKNRSCFNI